MADVQENVRLRKDPTVIFVEHRFFSFNKKGKIAPLVPVVFHNYFLLPMV